jgi:hypothetical protein
MAKLTPGALRLGLGQHRWLPALGIDWTYSQESALSRMQAWLPREGPHVHAGKSEASIKLGLVSHIKFSFDKDPVVP